MSAPLPWPQRSTPLRAWSAVVVLTLAYILSFVDRLVLAVLIEPLKRDLLLTDVQIALLHGTAFAVFYSIVGVPVAWLADRWSRKRIIVLGMLLWSATTALAGYCRSFPQLFACRMGVGLGEAALTPAAYSLFSDLFPRDRLARAIGVYMTGGVLGSGIALLVVGALLGHFEAHPEALAWALPGLAPWQKTLVMVGVPGLLFAILVQAVVRDPRGTALRSADRASARVASSQVAGAQIESETGSSGLWRHLRSEPRPFAAATLGYAFLTVYAYSFVTWTSSFLVRSFNLPAADAGALVGLLMLTAGIAGPTAGGMLCDRMLKRGHALAPLHIMAIGFALLPVPTAVAFLSPALAYSVAGLCVSVLIFSGLLTTGPAAIQLIAPPAHRASAAAVSLLVSNIVGLGLGPLSVALCTDYLFPGPTGLAMALSVVLIAAALLGLLSTRLAPRAARGDKAAAAPVAAASAATPGSTE